MNSDQDSHHRLAALEQYLGELQKFGIKLGLEQTADLFRRSGAPLTNHYIHIAGTNGKGSCGAMLESALRRLGFRTGFYTSPHLVDLRERFRIDGRAVAAETLLHAAEELKIHAEAMKQNGASPTFFEFTTALAARLFADAEVDFVIWETGMGGRFDATSVVEPELALITNIALDHQQYLGDTIAKIAFEKAGIIRGGHPVFTGIMPQEALEVIRRQADELGAPLITADTAAYGPVQFGRDERGLYQEFSREGRMIKLHLIGAMQRRNFRAVYPVLCHLADRYRFDLNAALDALGSARWPGRCQELNERLLIDGGHNPDGAAALAEALEETFPGEKFTVIFAGFKDKDVSQNLRPLARIAAEFIFTPIADARPSYSGGELHELLKPIADLPVLESSGTAEALRLAGTRPYRTLAAGSLYLAGEILELTAPDAALDLI